MTDLRTAREAGHAAADACTDKAERVSDFDTEAARRFVLWFLGSEGPHTGEDIVDAAALVGLRPHDTRAFGSVFSGLARDGRIVRDGFALRRKGHGTAGATRWRIGSGVHA